MIDSPFGRIPENLFELAAFEIASTYGYRVDIDRKTLHKFGRNKSLGTSIETVAFEGFDPLISSSNSITHVSSTDAGDDQTISVEGMRIFDGDLIFVNQTATLNGQTSVALATPLCVVTRIANNRTPSTETAGDVYAYENGATTGGVPDNTATIGAVMSQVAQSTVQAFSAIASTNYFLLSYLYADVNKKTAATIDVALQIKPLGGAWRDVKIRSATNGSTVDCPFSPYLVVPPNHFIRIRSASSAADTDVTAGFVGTFADITED